MAYLATYIWDTIYIYVTYLYLVCTNELYLVQPLLGNFCKAIASIGLVMNSIML
jgi:hypothetical protein